MNIVFLALIQKHVKYALNFSMTLITKRDIPSMYIIFSYVKL